MALVKREYREAELSRELMNRCAAGFNRLRPQSAWTEEDRDGQQVLLVRGWLPHLAAALVALVKAGCPAAAIDEAGIAARAAALDKESEDPAYAGHPRADLGGPPINPLAPPPPEPPLMDLSDVPANAPAVTAPAPGPAAASLLPEERMRQLVAALGVVYGLPEEEALRRAIGEAARRTAS